MPVTRPRPNPINQSTVAASPDTFHNTFAPSNLKFYGKDGKEVGRMAVNEGRLEFTGTADTAAQVFIEWCQRMWQDQKHKDREELLEYVIDNLTHEARGELYSEEEKVAILTCVQRVRELKKIFPEEHTP